MKAFVDYYVQQWKEKLEYINYFDTDGPRTTNGNECYHSSLNTVIPEKRLDFRICYIRYKESLSDAADDYVRSKLWRTFKTTQTNVCRI
uniref:Transposase n=1 Tax=Panagrolaimus superbus TaxID=310955 RepID=A0A914Z773_9BILA